MKQVSSLVPSVSAHADGKCAQRSWQTLGFPFPCTLVDGRISKMLCDAKLSVSWVMSKHVNAEQKCEKLCTAWGRDDCNNNAYLYVVVKFKLWNGRLAIQDISAYAWLLASAIRSWISILIWVYNWRATAASARYWSRIAGGVRCSAVHSRIAIRSMLAVAAEMFRHFYFGKMF